MNNEILTQSYTQSVGNAVYLADNRKAGIRAHKALHKAMSVIESNDSIIFKGGILKFRSKAGNLRIVTKAGCHESCTCRGMMSYHYALWLILDRYHKLQSALTESRFDLEAQTKMVDDIHRMVIQSTERHDKFQAEKLAREYAWRMGL